jgi:predicted Rossmann fold nucleotide-binding protein DprA/Smf involved in DNA uptake
MLVDELALAADIPVNKLAGILLNLELSGRVECLPGKVYQLG